MSKSNPLVLLKFKNRTSKDCSQEIVVERISCKKISEWYASFCSGDDFSVYIDDEKQEQDTNGAIYE